MLGPGGVGPPPINIPAEGGQVIKPGNNKLAPDRSQLNFVGMPSEKEKMLAGELYHAFDPELSAERLSCRQRLREFNDSLPEDFAKRARILKELLGRYHKTTYIEPPFRCDYGYNISVGEKFYANFDCVFLDVCPINIGENVMLGPGVHIYAAKHPLDPVERATFIESGSSVTIGDNVWIGGRAIVMPGVSIGENTVIGAGSVVTKSIPKNVVAAGSPCRVTREIR